MRYSSIDLQKKIKFIPVINIGVFFLAAINCRKTSNPIIAGVKLLAISACCMLLTTFLWSLLTLIFPRLEDLFFLCSIYTGPLCMSLGLIKFQEKELNT